MHPCSSFLRAFQFLPSHDEGERSGRTVGLRTRCLAPVRADPRGGDGECDEDGGRKPQPPVVRRRFGEGVAAARHRAGARNLQLVGERISLAVAKIYYAETAFSSLSSSLLGGIRRRIMQIRRRPS